MSELGSLLLRQLPAVLISLSTQEVWVVYVPWKSAPAISPATDKSSSSSGQCSEVPPPPISYLVRCSVVAARNKGNQIIGALMRRPSVRVTCIISSSKSTDLASAVVGTNALCDLVSVLTKVLIPSLQKKLLVLLNQFADLVQLPT